MIVIDAKTPVTMRRMLTAYSYGALRYRYLETVYNADWLTAQGINILQNTNLTTAIANLLPVPLDIVGRSQA